MAHNEWSDPLAEWIRALFLDAEEHARQAHRPLRVFARGTKFQVRVWKALVRIPQETRVSCGELAESLGERAGERAVGSAVGKNPLACVIPCCRVDRQTTVISDQRPGFERKQALIATETCRRNLQRRPEDPQTPRDSF